MSTLKQTQRNGNIRLLGFLFEDFMLESVEMTKQGFEIIPETCTKSGSGYAVEYLVPTEEVVSDNDVIVIDEDASQGIVEPVKIIGTLNMDVSDAIAKQEAPKPVLDLAVIDSFKKDKLKLDQYAETLGVNLNRSKKFENMVKDLASALVGG